MTCPLCAREVPGLTRHHSKTRREGDDILGLCPQCHKAIHGLFTNRELRSRPELQTLEGLQADPLVAAAVSHIRKLAPGEFMRMRERKRR